MLDPNRWVSGKVRVDIDESGRLALTGPGYHRPLPYPLSFLEKLASAYPGPALVEELLVAEEPGRFAARAQALLEGMERGGRMLHWGAAALGATVAIAKLGWRIDAADRNPLYAPLADERLGHVGLADQVRIVDPELGDRSYDALILVGERLLRPTLPSKNEIEGLLPNLRADSRILLLGWPTPAGSPPLPAPWSPVLRPSRRFARNRLLRPRGEAPIPSGARKALGFLSLPLVMAFPGLVSYLFQEEYAVFQARPEY